MIKRPPSRRLFLGPGDELNHVSDMLHYFIAAESIEGRTAARYVRRFEELLRAIGRDDGSILTQQYWAQLYEIRGDVRRAARHREREIELVERLFAIGGPVESVNPQYSINEAFLAREMRVLHGHYVALGDPAKAKRLLARIEKLPAASAGGKLASKRKVASRGRRNSAR
jgi:hypothetical protein